MSAGNGHVCPMCGSWVSPGMAHVCSFITPGVPPLQPINPACRAPWVPLTADDVRRIMIEVLEKDKAQATARDEVTLLHALEKKVRAMFDFTGWAEGVDDDAAQSVINVEAILRDLTDWRLLQQRYGHSAGASNGTV